MKQQIYFLDVFGLESLEQLSTSEIVSNEEINKFLQKLGGRYGRKTAKN